MLKKGWKQRIDVRPGQRASADVRRRLEGARTGLRRPADVGRHRGELPLRHW